MTASEHGRHRADPDGPVVPRWIVVNLAVIVILAVAAVVAMFREGGPAALLGTCGAGAAGGVGTLARSEKTPHWAGLTVSVCVLLVAGGAFVASVLTDVATGELARLLAAALVGLGCAAGLAVLVRGVRRSRRSRPPPG